MKKYICSICGYEYDEAAQGKWEDLNEDWECPLCGAPKLAFEEKHEAVPKRRQSDKNEPAHAEKGMSLYEMSALCSNLAKGCEKQQNTEQFELFKSLADYFKNADDDQSDVTLDELREPVQYDLDSYASAKDTAKENSDRGALRALIWSEKVTKIVASILLRYGKQKDDLVENKGVYVCEICGFVYIGEALPDVCPVCKVPNFKMRKIARR